MFLIADPEKETIFGLTLSDDRVVEVALRCVFKLAIETAAMADDDDDEDEVTG